LPSQLANTHAAVQATLRDEVARSVLAIWNALPDHSNNGLNLFMRTALPLIEAGQRTTIRTVDGYFAQEMGRPAYGLDEDALIGGVRGSVKPEEVYRRGFVTLWTAFKRGTGTYETVNPRVLIDIEARVKMDMLLAATHSARAVATRDPEIGALWRVTTGTCDLCEDALAMATPATGLMPVHPGCECAFEPMGHQLAKQILPRGISEAKGRQLAAIARNMQRDTLTVSRVAEHGEYGDILADAELIGKDATRLIDDVSASKQGAGAVKSAIIDINETHRWPSAMESVKVDVETGAKSYSPGAGAYFVPQWRLAQLTKLGLRYGGADGAQSMVIHELGHAFDNGLMRMLVKEMSDLRYKTGALSRAEDLIFREKGTYLSELARSTGWEDVRMSAEMRTIREELGNVMKAINDSAARRTVAGIKNNNKYYNSGRELFARAYNQYVVYKREDEGMIDFLESDAFSGIQWHRADFQPILEAFDQMFRRLGLLKESREATLKGGAVNESMEAMTKTIAQFRRQKVKWNDIRRALGVNWTDTKMRNMLKKYGYDIKGNPQIGVA